MEAAIDFTFIYDLVNDMYSEVGRPSIDPVILVKLTFIQYTFGPCVKRLKKLKQIWLTVGFLGYGFHDKAPHFSTFGENYERRFKDTDLFEQIFYRILMTAADRKLISAEHIFVDSTHVKVSANKREFEKKIVHKEARANQGRLQDEINQDRVNHGKKLFPPDKFVRLC
ncbi:transposase [Peribacillus sp. NPDC060253]|uniref:transposase n=1 Tax=Peribacillus sp. NPDC060253 TaxID=3347084 RepID=UPI003667FE31